MTLGRRLAGDDRPRQPARRRGPRSSGCAPAREAAGSHARAPAPGLPRVPRLALARAAGAHRRRSARRTPTGWHAEDGWFAGAETLPFPPRDALRLRPASSARTRSRALLRRPRQRVRSRLAAADSLRREVNGDDVTYVVTRNVNYTNVCSLQARSSARSPRASSPRTCAARVRRAARGDRPPRARGVGPGARRDTASRATTGLRRRLLRIGRGGDQGRVPDLHVHRLALEVWQGAATLGLPLERLLAGSARLGRRRSRGRPLRSSTTRRAPSSARQGERPSSGSRCTAPRTARGCARLRRSCSATWTRRARGHATCSRCASSTGRRAGSPSSRRCPSCTRRRRFRKGPRAPRPDLPRGAARARGRAARASPVDHERPGVLGEARPGGAAAALAVGVQRHGRDADERVDLARRRARATARRCCWSRWRRRSAAPGACPGSARRSTGRRRPSASRPRPARRPLAEPLNPPRGHAPCSAARRWIRLGLVTA